MWNTLRGLSFALCLAMACPAGWAQGLPGQTLKIVVPFPPGGGIDVLARILAPKLADELKVQAIVDNRAGAGGMLGATLVAQSPPDGTTLLMGSGSTHGTNSAVYAKMGYDAIRDFAPVVQTSQSPLAFVVAPPFPASSIKELIALAKAKPDSISYASYGPGSINHLGSELFNAMAGITTLHVPYKGTAPALIDLMGGRVDFTLDGVSTTLGYIQSGKLKALGVAGAKRSPLLPDVPTIAESALPGYDTSVMTGLFAPAGTPKATVDLLNQKANNVLRMADVREAMGKLSIEPVGGGPEVLAARVKVEIDKWSKLVKERNIKVDQ